MFLRHSLYCFYVLKSSSHAAVITNVQLRSIYATSLCSGYTLFGRIFLSQKVFSKSDSRGLSQVGVVSEHERFISYQIQRVFLEGFLYNVSDCFEEDNGRPDTPLAVRFVLH